MDAAIYHKIANGDPAPRKVKEANQHEKNGIGKTSSGKTIYASEHDKYSKVHDGDMGRDALASHTKNRFKNYTAKDHREASNAHNAKVKHTPAGDVTDATNHHFMAALAHHEAAKSMGGGDK